MNEDDTFLLLKRTPFDEAALMLKEHALKFTSTYNTYDPYLTEHADELLYYLDEYARKLGWCARDFCCRAKDTDIGGKLKWTPEAYLAIISKYDKNL